MIVNKEYNLKKTYLFIFYIFHGKKEDNYDNVSDQC